MCQFIRDFPFLIKYFFILVAVLCAKPLYAQNGQPNNLCTIGQSGFYRTSVVLKDIVLKDIVAEDFDFNNWAVDIQFNRDAELIKVWGDAQGAENIDGNTIRISIDQEQTGPPSFGLKAKSQGDVTQATCYLVYSDNADDADSSTDGDSPVDDDHQIDDDQQTDNDSQTDSSGDYALIYAINSGGKQYTAKDGTEFVADFAFNQDSKAKVTTQTAIVKTADDPLYQAQRWSQNLLYQLPVSEGNYTVELLLAEHTFNDAGSRVVSFIIENDTLVTNLDVVAQHGAKTAAQYILEDVYVVDGLLTIRGEAIVNNPSIAGVVVTSKNGSALCNAQCQQDDVNSKNADSNNDKDKDKDKDKDNKSVLKNYLFENRFSNNNELKKLGLYKGAANAKIETYNIAGRKGTGLNIEHKKATNWISTLGKPKLKKAVDEATIRYSVYFPKNDWQYRWQGKLPGLAPAKPHFGGNKDDNPIWDRWSIRLMWLSKSGFVEKNNDNQAVPSIYIYDQDRKKGKTGTHHRVESFKMPKGEWVDIEMHIKLNSYDNNRKAKRDGVVSLTINGKFVEKITGLKLRGNIPKGKNKNSTSISNLAFHNYYGGNKKDYRNVPTKNRTSVLFDDLTVY